MKKIINNKYPAFESEKRLCFFNEGEPQPEVHSTDSEKPKSKPIDRSSDKEKSGERTRREEKSREEDSDKLKEIEHKMELSVYADLEKEIIKMKKGGDMDLAKILKIIESLSDDPKVPGSFSGLNLTKLAIMQPEAVENLLLDVRSRIVELKEGSEKLAKTNEFAEVRKAFEDELPVVNLSVILRPTSDLHRTYNPEGKPLSSIDTKEPVSSPVQSIANTDDGITWFKIGKSTTAPSFNEDYIYRQARYEELSHDLSKDDIKRLLVRYEAIIANMKDHRKGRGDIRRTANQIKSTKTFLAEIISGKKDLSEESVKSYEGIIYRLDYGGNELRCSLSDIAIMETADFDAIIGSMQKSHSKLYEKLDK